VDIPKLIEYFLKKFSLLSKKAISEIENGAMDLLLNYSWPGNVRELENSLEYAFARSKENIIKSSFLPPSIRIQPEKQKIWKSESIPSRSPVKNNKNGDELIKLLERYHWNRSKVAKELGIGRTTLWRRMRELNLI
jgi:transcriptional regulator with PAS, ATPase and Fis domain